MKKIETPELDKMIAVRDKSQTIGEFLEWLQSGELSLCEWIGNGYFSTSKTIENILAEYFEIDEQKAEQERQALLNQIRANNVRRD